jgi:hypothetical protein
MRMRQGKTLILSFVLLLALSLLVATFSSDFLSATNDTISVEASSSGLLVPQPLSPSDQSEFVDSDIVLKWKWPQALAGNQVFAIRIWYEDEAPIEVWTDEMTINAQEHIDSFSHDLALFIGR